MEGFQDKNGKRLGQFDPFEDYVDAYCLILGIKNL